MNTPRQHADLAVRYFMDNTTNCWARNEGSNNEWTPMPDPRFNVPGLEYHVGHEPPPIKRTITVPAATIELRPGDQYAGLVLKDDGTPSHHLVRMACPPPARLSWQDAKDWASNVGGEMPTRRELSLIYAHHHIKRDWCWSGEVCKDDASFAWGCNLRNGYQNSNHKAYEADVVVVRRILIGGAAAPYLTMLRKEIDNLRAQLAEAQRDAERLDWIIEHRAYVVSDPDCCDGYWLNYARPDGTMWTQATEHETPRAAIDAAKGEPS